MIERLYLKNLHLGFVLIALWAGLMVSQTAINWFDQSRGADPWLTIHEVYVHDANAGEPVRLMVNRTIHQPFHGKWLVTVRRRSGFDWMFHCSATGETYYHPDNKLPDPLTLDWWTYPKECEKTPGCYQMITRWKIVIPNKPVRVAESWSNEFCIAAAVSSAD